MVGPQELVSGIRNQKATRTTHSYCLGQQSFPPTSAYLLRFVHAPLQLLLWHSLHMATPASDLLTWHPYMPSSGSVFLSAQRSKPSKLKILSHPEFCAQPNYQSNKCEERIKTLADMQWLNKTLVFHGIFLKKLPEMCFSSTRKWIRGVDKMGSRRQGI